MIVILDVIKIDTKTYSLNKTWREILNLVKKGKVIWINDNFLSAPQNLYMMTRISKTYSMMDSKEYYTIDAGYYSFYVDNADDYITFKRG